MRIVTGSLKGRRLLGPPPGDLAVRPTSDKAREALFSILETRPRGTFLDLFAGTGAVGLEAWSRGHAPVTCVEAAAGALKLLRANTAGSGVRIEARDARRLGPAEFAGLDLVFADPPYDESALMLDRLAPRILGWLADDGWLIWEGPAAGDLPVPAGFRLLDRRRYGAAAFYFLGR